MKENISNLTQNVGTLFFPENSVNFDRNLRLTEIEPKFRQSKFVNIFTEIQNFDLMFICLFQLQHLNNL